MDRRSLLTSKPTNTDPTTNKQQNTPGPLSASTAPKQQFAPIPMEEGEINSESDQDPSVLEVPAWNWAG